MIKIIHNAQTGEKLEIELLPEEIEEIKQRADLAKQEAEAKKGLLQRLGITEEEARLLLGGN